MAYTIMGKTANLTVGNYKKIISKQGIFTWFSIPVTSDQWKVSQNLPESFLRASLNPHISGCFTTSMTNYLAESFLLLHALCPSLYCPPIPTLPSLTDHDVLQSKVTGKQKWFTDYGNRKEIKPGEQRHRRDQQDPNQKIQKQETEMRKSEKD